MKVLVLLNESLIPPESFKSKVEHESSPCRTEYDVVQGLNKLKHKVKILGVGDDLRLIRQSIDEFKPHVVYNLLEEFAGEAVFDHNVVSYLEMLRVKYTGCNPRGLMLSRDKSISKKIFKYHRIPTPQFYVFKKNKKIKIQKNLQFPLFVKTLNEEASLGISQESIVTNLENLVKRTQFLHSKYNTDVIAESYIKGRELYVGVMGNESVKVLPVMELFFSKTPESVPKIATSKVKWNEEYRKKMGIKTGPAAPLSEDLEKRIKNLSKRAYRALEISGYARMDFRYDELGDKLYLIEANPNPDIAKSDEFAKSAQLANVPYEKLLSKILSLAKRWTTV